MSSVSDELFEQAVPVFMELTQEQMNEMGLSEDGLTFISSSEPRPALWKVKELAAALRVSPGMVYAWINRGDIAVIRTPGGRIRIPVAEAQCLLKAHVQTREDSPLTQHPGEGV